MGLWIAEKQFRAFRNNLDAWNAAITSHETLPEVPQGAYLRCPDCNAAMARKNFARTSGVLIDQCYEHGIWFDGGELKEIAKQLQQGLKEPPPRETAPSSDAFRGGTRPSTTPRGEGFSHDERYHAGMFGDIVEWIIDVVLETRF